MGRADGRRMQVVEREVAVGDGVDRVLREPVEAEISRRLDPVQLPVQPRQSARPEGHRPGRGGGGGEAVGVAAQHPEPGEEVVAEGHRLGSLQVGVAGKSPVGVLGGEAQQLGERVADQVDGVPRPVGDVEREVGGHLVVARAAGVELAAERPDHLRQPPLDRHVDVLVGLLEGELAGLELRGDPVEPGEHLLQLVLGEDSGPEQGPGVSPRSAHVVGRQAAIERQRRVQLPEDWVGLLLETGHDGAVYERRPRLAVARRETGFRLPGCASSSPVPRARSATP